MPRKCKGLTPRKPVAIRLQDSEKKLLKQFFGGVQGAVDFLLDEVIKNTIAKHSKKRVVK